MDELPVIAVTLVEPLCVEYTYRFHDGPVVRTACPVPRLAKLTQAIVTDYYDENEDHRPTVHMTGIVVDVDGDPILNPRPGMRDGSLFSNSVLICVTPEAQRLEQAILAAHRARLTTPL